MNQTLLAADDLHFAYGGGRPILSGIDLTVSRGEIVALLGANGSGKSTLLKLLLGLLKPLGGGILLGKRPLSGWSQREIAQHVAYVPQSQSMPFPYRVRDLVALGRISRRGLLGRLTRQDHNAIDAALARLGITDLATQPCTELSGGQRQLCLIARALAQDAPLIVMDEPVTGLDYGNQWRLLALLGELAAEGQAFIKTTHHPEHALGVASRVILLQHGRIIGEGVPADVITPEQIQRLYDLRVTYHQLPHGAMAMVPEPRTEASRHV
jgi:iron complex transport system ATP-binding protein